MMTRKEIGNLVMGHFMSVVRLAVYKDGLPVNSHHQGGGGKRADLQALLSESECAGARLKIRFLKKKLFR